MMFEVADVPAPDYLPAILGIVGVLVGGLLAWVASLVGAAKEAKREHARWEREQRLEAYVALATVCDNMPSLKDTTSSAYMDSLRSAVLAVELMGPPTVYEIGHAYFQATAIRVASQTMEDKDGSNANLIKAASLDYNEKRRAFLTAARGALGITG